MRDDLLFYPNDLRAALEAKVKEMRRAIEEYDGNRLLNTSEDDLVRYFASLGAVETLVLREQEITVDQTEAEYDVSHRFEYNVWDRSQPSYVPGTLVTLHIPFAGEPELFRFKASSSSLNPPRGEIRGNELMISYLAPHAEAGGAKRHFDEELRRVRQGIDWVNSDVRQHNESLVRIARETVRARRERLLANQKLVASLGYPLRARPDAAQTYALPDLRRKAVPTPPPASSAPFVPEPALSDALYDQILQVMSNMVRVMEQSPEAFAGMKEEDLRTHFLVQLNGQFEGRASAETFRGSGSTDILLVEQDKSVFIAECKFWNGPASLNAAVDQLLDYATWRDAKTGIVLFSRNKDFSEVVASVPLVLRDHPQTVGEVTTLGETAFRSRLRQRADPSRLLTLTTLVYDVPASRSRSARLVPRSKRTKGP